MSNDGPLGTTYEEAWYCRMSGCGTIGTHGRYGPLCCVSILTRVACRVWVCLCRGRCAHIGTVDDYRYECSDSECAITGRVPLDPLVTRIIEATSGDGLVRCYKPSTTTGVMSCRIERT
jgi:hypothetical protein